MQSFNTTINNQFLWFSFNTDTTKILLFSTTDTTTLLWFPFTYEIPPQTGGSKKPTYTTDVTPRILCPKVTDKDITINPELQR